MMFGEELYLVNKYAKKIRDEKRLIKEQIKGVLFEEEDYSEKEISERLKLEIDKNISPKVLKYVDGLTFGVCDGGGSFHRMMSKSDIEDICDSYAIMPTDEKAFENVCSFLDNEEIENMLPKDCDSIEDLDSIEELDWSKCDSYSDWHEMLDICLNDEWYDVEQYALDYQDQLHEILHSLPEKLMEEQKMLYAIKFYTIKKLHLIPKRIVKIKGAETCMGEYELDGFSFHSPVEDDAAENVEELSEISSEIKLNSSKTKKEVTKTLLSYLGVSEKDDAEKIINELEKKYGKMLEIEWESSGYYFFD